MGRPGGSDRILVDPELRAAIGHEQRAEPGGVVVAGMLVTSTASRSQTLPKDTPVEHQA